MARPKHNFLRILDTRRKKFNREVWRESERQNALLTASPSYQTGKTLGPWPSLTPAEMQELRELLIIASQQT